jgi:hypothetical protein
MVAQPDTFFAYGEKYVSRNDLRGKRERGTAHIRRELYK